MQNFPPKNTGTHVADEGDFGLRSSEFESRAIGFPVLYNADKTNATPRQVAVEVPVLRRRAKREPRR